MKKKQLDKGFTLLEILISGAVLALVMVGLATLMTYTMKSDSQARTRSYATELAQSRIDFFRQERSILGWGGLSSVLETRTYCLNGVNSFSTSVSNNIFSSLPTGDNCPFAPVSGDISMQIKQVASVEVDADEINVEIIISWLNDAGEEVFVNSIFKLAKNFQDSVVFVPVAPSATLVPPSSTPVPTQLSAPTGVIASTWLDGYGSSCVGGNIYYFKVYAYDFQDNPGLGSSTANITMPAGDDTIAISWNAVSGAEYYRVYMSQDPLMTSGVYYGTALASTSIDMTCSGTSGQLP